ncbi:ABC transporter permease [Streptomyces ferrugineus]|uniref:ABC transporter permease n=1 Tax=Streptomyces ferrugineus TaxID=1413221 RepID=A0A7M2S9X4_9ACTN|nr:ABC transporter permease [Streptomyces ferrugineus]QOV33157.1 ABC transporter permease [Streptomyces ferrugineus]
MAAPPASADATETPTSSPVATSTQGWARLSRLRLRSGALIGVLAVEILFWSLASPAFLTESNVINILRAASVVGVIAVGMLFVILTAGIDLSVGSMVSFAGIAVAAALGVVDSFGIALLVTLAVGAVSGLFAGTLVARLRVPALITTLGLLYVLAAGAQIWNGGRPLPIVNETVILFGSGYVGPIPSPVLVLFGTYVVGWYVLTQTKFGRHVYAIGGNPRAARLAGVPVERTITFVYVISGVLAAMGGLLYAGRLATASPLTGTALELQVIAAAVVGGASLFGGRGTLRDTFIGVLILAILQNGMTLAGVPGFWQTFANGVALLIAVLLSGDSALLSLITRRKETSS